MMRHTSRIIPAALAAVLVLGACGAADDDAAPEPPGTQPSDGMRAPTPIEIVSGATSGDRVAAPAAESAPASDAMIAPYFDIEYVLGDGLVAPTDDTGYVFDGATPLTAEQVTQLAAAFGITGDPVRSDDGYTVSWRVGPEDGTAPSLWVADDAQQYWSYSMAWADQEGMARVACAVSVDSDGNEIVEDCPEPEPPVGVPTAAEAEQRARDLLAAMGVDAATVELETYADEWSASVTATSTLDPRAGLTSWNFAFGAEGVLQYAGGTLATPTPVGPYPLVDVATAFQRLQDRTFGGFAGGPAGGPMIAVDDVAVDDVAVAPEPEPDLPEAGEPMIPEPMPVDGTLPEPEQLTVTLVDVQADLWWAWDADGSVWVLPAYRFIGDDGGWYSVPAVTDEFLIQVEPPVAPMPLPEEPMPVEPDEGDGGGTLEPVPAEPAAPPIVDDLAGYLGLPLEEFTAQVEALGYTVRVVETDGDPLAVTDDFVDTRINVAVETVNGVETVVRAATDGGMVIGEIAAPDPTTDPTTDPTAESTAGTTMSVDDLRAELDGSLPSPLDAFTTDAVALGFVTRVVREDGEWLDVTADERSDRVNVEVVDGAVVAIDSIG